MPAFKEGDLVLWSHAEATKHADGSVVRASFVGSLAVEAHPHPCHGTVGRVAGAANEQGTWFDVDFGDGNVVTLTSDELVRVEEGT